MDDEGLEFRATKDVDLVVLARSTELNQRILAYVKDGGYNTKESTENLPKFYRFQKPTNLDCPKMIEIFARNELGLEVDKDQQIVPISEPAAERLSAILLDDEYFGLIQTNIATSESGIPLVNALANICLKARAHRDLFERRASGDHSIDEKDVQKHLKDIWRLAATLTGTETIALTGSPARDVTTAIEKLDKLPLTQFKQVMDKIPGAKLIEVMAALRQAFGTPSWAQK